VSRGKRKYHVSVCPSVRPSVRATNSEKVKKLRAALCADLLRRTAPNCAELRRKRNKYVEYKNRNTLTCLSKYWHSPVSRKVQSLGAFVWCSSAVNCVGVKEKCRKKGPKINLRLSVTVDFTAPFSHTGSQIKCVENRQQFKPTTY